jgi:hypothetical protein
MTCADEILRRMLFSLNIEASYLSGRPWVMGG